MLHYLPVYFRVLQQQYDTAALDSKHSCSSDSKSKRSYYIDEPPGMGLWDSAILKVALNAQRVL